MLKKSAFLTFAIILSGCQVNKQSKLTDTTNSPGYDLTSRAYVGASGECVEFLSNTNVYLRIDAAGEEYTYTKMSGKSGLSLSPINSGGVFTGIVPFTRINGITRGWPKIILESGTSSPGPNGSIESISKQVELNRVNSSCKSAGPVNPGSTRLVIDANSIEAAKKDIAIVLPTPSMCMLNFDMNDSAVAEFELEAVSINTGRDIETLRVVANFSVSSFRNLPSTIASINKYFGAHADSRYLQNGLALVLGGTATSGADLDNMLNIVKGKILKDQISATVLCFPEGISTSIP